MSLQSLDYVFNVGELKKLLQNVDDSETVYIHYEPNYEDRFVVTQELDGSILFIPVEKLKDLLNNQNLEFKNLSV